MLINKIRLVIYFYFMHAYILYMRIPIHYMYKIKIYVRPELYKFKVFLTVDCISGITEMNKRRISFTLYSFSSSVIQI